MTLSSSHLQVQADPACGGKLRSLVSLRSGREYFYRDTRPAFDGEWFDVPGPVPSDLVGPFDLGRRTFAKLFSDRLQEGRAAVEYPDTAERLVFSFDARTLPHLGLLAAQGYDSMGDGHFAGEYLLALEPTTGIGDDIPTCQRTGTLRVLEPGAELSFRICISLEPICAATRLPFARRFTLRNDPDLMRPYLDMGAGGVLVPFVNTAEEASRGARAVRYPPVETRGYGPARASKYGLEAAEYFATANDHLVYIPMLEDAEAVRNCEALLAVEGVDSFIIGPVDLSISLGIPMQFEHPKFQEAEREVIRAGRAAAWAWASRGSSSSWAPRRPVAGWSSACWTPGRASRRSPCSGPLALRRP